VILCIHALIAGIRKIQYRRRLQPEGATVECC